jgi:SAM-dependent methyltransferase
MLRLLWLGRRRLESNLCGSGLTAVFERGWKGNAAGIADWRLGTGENRKTYYSQVHPKISQYVLSLLPALPTPKDVTILDIAGGNGDLAERIIKEAGAQAAPGTQLTYILVDYSEADVAIAKRRFANMILPPGFPVKPVALTRDMLRYGYDAAAAREDFGIPKGADIIINSGGLLNNQIGNDNQTPLRFNQMYGQMLKPGGYGVYSGLTPLLVNAKMHRDQGLTVINLYDPQAQRQMHVVQRPT